MDLDTLPGYGAQLHLSDNSYMSSPCLMFASPCLLYASPCLIYASPCLVRAHRYLRSNHNSVLGIREYAVEQGGSFQVSDEAVHAVQLCRADALVKME